MGLRGQVSLFVPEAEPQQEPLPFKCRFCRDTGVLGEYAFCWCEAGQRARKRREEESDEDELE